MVSSDGFAWKLDDRLHLMENLIWKRLDLAKVCMWGHLSARGRTANAFLCFGTVSPDSAFRLHRMCHRTLALEGPVQHLVGAVNVWWCVIRRVHRCIVRK